MNKFCRAESKILELMNADFGVRLVENELLGAGISSIFDGLFKCRL
jgi:hypothetical protein